MAQEATVTVELSAADAELFKVFRRHQDAFKQLMDGGVFDHLVGHLTIHKNGVAVRMIEVVKIQRFK